MKNKLLLGLTGKTGAGKSTVAQLLSAYGAAIIDGDAVAREILLTDESVLPALAEAFGADIIIDGELNRTELARRAFKDEKSTAELNAITHPAITKRIEELVMEAYSHGFGSAVVDAAALIESGFADSCDRLVVVHAPKDIRLERVLTRDGISTEDALRRINAQKDDAFYTDKADYVVRNYPPFILTEELENVKKLIKAYK